MEIGRRRSGTLEQADQDEEQPFYYAAKQQQQLSSVASALGLSVPATGLPEARGIKAADGMSFRTDKFRIAQAIRTHCIGKDPVAAYALVLTGRLGQS
ncbi:hypothetical protein TWF970_009343 [Orbilia oligospora]|uniref:Uncharacterized protein n=1 Tax=Orbilia oligospora TaxID=2813651 RepID=A0A7C8R5C5_ORBOL|nr:hypothetical protein TWF970_009343 [Orbilia oligospora]